MVRIVVLVLLRLLLVHHMLLVQRMDLDWLIVDNDSDISIESGLALLSIELRLLLLLLVLIVPIWIMSREQLLSLFIDNDHLWLIDSITIIAVIIGTI